MSGTPKYDPKSLKAEEFINDAEILETIEYAEKNKNNTALVDEILEKAKLRKEREKALKKKKK